MKTKIFFLSVLSSLLLGCETVQHSNYSQPKIGTKVIPAYLSKSGEPEFVILSDGFGGDCCKAPLSIDSVNYTDIYVSCTYNSGCKCSGMFKSDTIALGKLQDGDYTIHFTLIDIAIVHEDYPLPPNTDEHYELFFVHKGQY
ncbi:MAG: hypothetical protein J6W37_09865 [Bacteroidales bacterium]|nr:hypothetical protein [Bacteroidales bacterium]